MRLSADLSPEQAAHMLAGLVLANIAQIEQAVQRGVLAPGQTPLLDGLRSGAVRYERVDPGEDWKDWQRLLTDGWGDCEDLVPAICAEYIVQVGLRAEPIAYWPGGDAPWHVVACVERAPLLEGPLGRAELAIRRILGLGNLLPGRGVWYADPSVMGGMGAV